MKEPRLPIDLPDDFGTDEAIADVRVASAAAVALFAVFAIAVIVLVKVLA